MTKQKRVLLILAAAVLAAAALFFALRPRGAGPLTGENLLTGGDFETLNEKGLPREWYADAYVSTPGYTVFGSGEGRNGGLAAHIKNTAGNDARFAQTVSVSPNSLYLLHGYVRANAEGGLGANLSVEGVYVFSNCAFDTADQWEELTLYGRTGDGQTTLTVFARLGGYSGEATGEAWFDDVSLTQVAEVPAGFLAQDLFLNDAPVSAETEAAEPTGAVWLVLFAALYLGLVLYFVYSGRLLGGEHELHKKGPSLSAKIALLAGMTVLCAGVRVLVAQTVSGYDVDIGCFTAWANRMAEVGPAGFYADNYFSDYPPGYMLVLWLCGLTGRLLGTGATEFLVKLPSIIADLLGAFILMHYAQKRLGGDGKSETGAFGTALMLGALYLLNPLIVLSGAGWGQSDGVMTLFLLLTVIFALEGKWRFALPAYLTAVLMKPQALMFGPLGLLALILSYVSAYRGAGAFMQKEAVGKAAEKPRGAAMLPLLKDTLIGLGLMAAVFGVMVIPFSVAKGGVGWLFELYGKTMNSYSYATVNACNLYFLFGLNWAPASDAVPGLLACAMGALILFPALALSLKKTIDKKTRILCLCVMFAGALTGLTGALFSISFSALSSLLIALTLALVAANYILGGDIRHLPLNGALLLVLLFNMGGMMHERYLFPAIILLLLSYALEKDARILLLAAGLTASTLLNVGCVLSRNIRIGGSSGHLTAPAYGIESDMAALEYLSAALNVLMCMLTLYVSLDLCRGNAVPYSPKAASSRKDEGAERVSPSYLADEKAPLLPSRRMGFKDWLIVLATTVLYAGLAFWHLGSTKSPQTEYVFGASDEQVVFDLGTVYDDFRMLYFGGIHYYDSDFTVETSLDGVVWSEPYTCEMKIGSLFQWKYVKSYAASDARALSGRYARITADHIGLTLFEVLFRDADGNVLPVLSAVNSYDAPVNALIDEQDTLSGEPGWYNSMYFDEIYHARTAYEHLHGLSPYETTHPPLGKVIMSWCVALFGMTPFGWRFAGTLCGVLMLPGMYLLGKLLFKKRRYAVLSMLLMTFDCMHYTQTRLATIDSFVVLFIIWSVYFMLRWFFGDFYGRKLWRSLVPLGLSGLFMGLAVASKWTGCYAGVGLAVLFFYGIYRRARACREAKALWKAAPAPVKGGSGETALDAVTLTAANEGVRRLLLTVASCLIFFVLVPGVIYYCSYIPYFASSGGVSIKRIIKAAEGMLAYHSTPGLGMDHAFYSPWYEWPLSIKPMYYAADAYEPAGYASSILSFGNPAVWWVGLLCLLIVLYAFFRHQAYPALFHGMRTDEKTYPFAPKGERDVRPALLLICFAAQYLPWTLVPRGTYIYHYFPSVPFIILCTALVMEYLSTWLVSRAQTHALYNGLDDQAVSERVKRADRLCLSAVVLLILIAAGLFIAYFPYASGLMVPTGWLRAMNWFGNLYF